jgi:hypothetical protein
MKPINLNFTAVMLALLLAIPCTASAQSATIAGTVTDVHTGEPLQGARVAVASTGYAALTDQYGRYTLRAMAVASHDLTIGFPGYHTARVSVSVGPWGAPGPACPASKPGGPG